MMSRWLPKGLSFGSDSVFFLGALGPKTVSSASVSGFRLGQAGEFPAVYLLSGSLPECLEWIWSSNRLVTFWVSGLWSPVGCLETNGRQTIGLFLWALQTLPGSPVVIALFMYFTTNQQQ